MTKLVVRRLGSRRMLLKILDRASHVLASWKRVSPTQSYSLRTWESRDGCWSNKQVDQATQYGGCIVDARVGSLAEEVGDVATARVVTIVTV